MAEVIPLATFELDTTRLQNSLGGLQDRYFELKKEQENNAKQSKDVKKQIDALNKSQEELSKSTGDNTQALERNKRALQELNNTEKELFKSQQNTSSQMSVVRKEIVQTNTQLNSYRNTEAETTSLLDLGNEALERQINSKNDARAANIALNRVANQLNPAIDEENKLLIKLNAQMDKNTDFIKENSSETAKQKMNVGNYTNSIIDAYKALQKEAEELENCKIALQEQIEATDEGTEAYKIYIAQLNVLNVQINNVSDSMAEARGESEDLGAVSKLLSGNFLEIANSSQEAGGAQQAITGAFAATKAGIIGALQAGLAFIATPIGAVIAALAVAVGLVVGAFKLAKASLTSTEEGTQKLAVVTGAITGVFKGLFNIIKPLGLYMADVFIKTLENVGKMAEYVSDKLASALEFVGATEAAKGVRDFTAEVKASSVAAANLAKAEGELVVQQRQATKIQLDYQKQAEKLRQQRDDETNSIPKRIAINNELGKVLQKQSASELAIANKQLEVAKLKIKAEGETTDALNARAEAETNISDIQERITGQESEQLANLNSLRKEASDAQKERQEKETQRALELSKARIDLFIAEQGFKKKSAEEEYRFNYELYNRQYADLKLQLQKKQITQVQFDAQMLQLRSDYLAKNADLTIENAQLELDAVLSKNSRILDSDRFLSESQLAIKKQALAEDLAAQLEFERLRLENGEINQKQYNASINEINEENRLSNLELEEERKAAEQEKQLLDLEALKVTNEENFLAQAEIEKAQNEIKRQQEVAGAEKTGADVSLINAKYAKMNEDIDAAVSQNKLQLASEAFNGLAKIMGEETKLGKAAAIAQATIDTYKGVAAVWGAPSVVPEPFGTALKVVSTGVVLASGFQNVKKITATKTPTVSGSKAPSYATGVIGLRGAGTGLSDSITANLSSGESVINARSTSMFANELAAINQAGGGVGLNGTSNILTQNSLEQNANNNQMAQMIAEAVAIGAEAGTSKGSQNGIKSLSEDRRVMSDAKF